VALVLMDKSTLNVSQVVSEAVFEIKFLKECAWQDEQGAIESQ
jgi:hypothetical protein